MALPTTPLPPGYKWVMQSTGLNQSVPAIQDPSGAIKRTTGLDMQSFADSLWTQYNQATGGGGYAAGTPLTLQQLSNLGTAQQYEAGANERLLTDLEKEYSEVPNFLKQNYANAARGAGTFSNTQEFQVGLDSDVQAGARGARAGLSERINALRRSLGREEFQPGPDAPMSSIGEESTDPVAAPVGTNADTDDEADVATKDTNLDAVQSVTSTETEEQRKKRLAALAAASEGL